MSRPEMNFVSVSSIATIDVKMIGKRKSEYDKRKNTQQNRRVYITLLTMPLNTPTDDTIRIYQRSFKGEL
jgi:hypothetical protein